LRDAEIFHFGPSMRRGIFDCAVRRDFAVPREAFVYQHRGMM